MKDPLVENDLVAPKSEVQQSSKKHSGNTCFTIICWIFNLGVWGLLTYILVSYFCLKKEGDDTKDIKKLSYVLIAVYIVYLILEFCSSTSRYLRHKNSSEGIKKKMGELYKAQPSIKFYAECYHYETRTYTVTNNEGEEEERTKRVKVISHKESKYFSYYSVRDISGLLNLNCDIAQIKKKSYIKLELKEEINFADSISISDYEKQKSNFKRYCKTLDTHIDFSEYWSLPGMTHHNLIKINDKDPCMANFFWYFIFTILTLGQFYKIYIASLCIYQNYKIRKIMSTRYDLNSHKYDAQYSKFNPQINLVTLKIDYDPSYYCYLNSSMAVQKPTEGELENAKIYDSKVPKYEIYTEDDGDIKRVGTVKDNPDFDSYNNYQDQEAAIIPTLQNDLDQIKAQPNPIFNDNINNTPNSYNNVEQGGYNSAQQGIGGGIYTQLNDIIQPNEGSNLYDQPPAGNIYSQQPGNIYAQQPGNIYAQQPGPNIYGQPPGVYIYGRPLGGNIYVQPSGENINNQDPLGGNIYAQPSEGNIINQQPGGNIDGQPPNN